MSKEEVCNTSTQLLTHRRADEHLGIRAEFFLMSVTAPPGSPFST